MSVSRRTIEHENAHALTVQALGGTVRGVAFDPRTDSGRTECRLPANAGPERHAMVALAGPVWERMRRGDRTLAEEPIRGYSNDLLDCYDQIAKLPAHPELAQVLLQESVVKILTALEPAILAAADEHESQLAEDEDRDGW